MIQSHLILYLTHRVPYPPDKGDRIRNYHILRFLAERYSVHLACLSDEPVSYETRQVLNGICDRVAIIPLKSSTRRARMGWSLLTGQSASLSAFHSGELHSVIQKWSSGTGYDLALASSSSMAPYLDKIRRTTPVMIDLVDVDSEKWLNYASSSRLLKSWIYRREGVALRKYELEISQWAKAVLLVSDAERDLFRGISPDAPVQTITNGVDLDYFQPTQKEAIPGRCVFVGALDYHPNVDAVCWFADEVWPRVRKANPQATFQIVGRQPVASVLNLSGLPGIEVVGQVPDVRPYVQDACVVVAPLRIARGLQNKVLEAMAMGKPVIAGPPALAGLRLDVPNPAVRVNTIADWVSTLTDLLHDSTRSNELGHQGRDYVERYYHWKSCLEPLQQLIHQVTPVHKTQPGLSTASVAASSLILS